MSKHRQVPSPYRCLHGLRVSVAALVVMLGLTVLEGVLCSTLGRLSPACTFFTVPYAWWLGAMAVGGVAYTLYAAYRDFFRGQYYSDLAKVQQY